MTLEGAKLLVASWAVQKRLVRRVFFFGSRVRNEHRSDSDLDIAFELIYTAPNTSAGHWAFESDAWAKQLSSLLPWKLDLQLLEPQGTPTVASGIERSSVLVYERQA